MLQRFEKQAYTDAAKALAECIAKLKLCKVSVSTDYAVGVAIGYAEAAAAEIKHAVLCGDPDA